MNSVKGMPSPTCGLARHDPHHAVIPFGYLICASAKTDQLVLLKSLQARGVDFGTIDLVTRVAIIPNAGAELITNSILVGI